MDGTEFVYELFPDMDALREQIRKCEGPHAQQVCFSTYMDTLTQICFTEQKVRSTILWEDAHTWTP